MAPVERTWFDEGAGTFAPESGFALKDEKEVDLWHAVSAVKMPNKIITKRIASINITSF
jgi:hypothetical protein